MKLNFFWTAIFIFVFSVSYVSAVNIGAGTVLNTTVSNSSVTFSFDISADNFTVESTYVAIFGITFTNSSGTYVCDDVNFSAPNSNLDSTQFNCTGQNPTPRTSSGGGGSNSFDLFKENTLNDSISIDVRISLGDTAFMNFSKRNSLGLESLSIKVNKYLIGNIKINEVFKKPKNCIMPKFDNYETYKMIKFDHDFDDEKIDSVNLDLIIDKNWMRKNNVNKILAFKCNPELNFLETKLVNSDKSKYQITSDGFSVWIIGGLKSEIYSQAEETIEDSAEKQNIHSNIPENKNVKRDNLVKIEKSNFFYLIFSILLILLLFTALVLFLLIKKQKKKYKKKISRKRKKK